MTAALTIAIAIPWGVAAAWLWLTGTRRAAAAAMRGRRSGVGLRLLVASALVFAPALVIDAAVVGSLLGFVVGRNVLVFRAIGGERAGG
jgi:hypothetical protein